MKTCSKCQAAKPLDDFHRDQQTRDGLRSDCKVCVRARNRERYNADRVNRLAKRRAHYEANRDRLKAEMRAYDEANLEAKKARGRAYREAHAEEARERTKAWREANPDRCRMYGQVKRARKREAPCEDISADLVYERDAGVCGICGGATAPDDWHLDHIVPLSKGGHHLYENVQVSHPACNMRKGATVQAQREGRWQTERSGIRSSVAAL